MELLVQRMPLQLRSIPLALAPLLVLSIATAQPTTGPQRTVIERIATADRHAYSGSYDRSLKTLDAMRDPLRLASWDPTVRLRRAELLGYLRPRFNPDRDLAAFVDAYASSPHAPYAHIRRGLAALQRGEHGTARIHFDEAVASTVDRAPEQHDEAAAGTAYYWLAIAHLIDDDGALKDQAAAALRVSADEYPRSPFADDALFALAQMSEELGDLDSATAYYARLIERYPASDLRIEAAIRAAQNHLRLDQIEPARTLLGEIDLALSSTDRDPERRARHTAEFHLLSAAAHERSGDYADAERSYLKVAYDLETPYRRIAQLGLADTYNEARRPDSASAIYRRLLAQSSTDFAGMYSDYQIAALESERTTAADPLAGLKRIAADSSHRLAPRAAITLARIHYLRQEYSQADAILDGRLPPPEAPALRARAQFLRGLVQLALQHYKDADSSLVEAFELARTTPAVLMPDRDTVASRAGLAGAIAMIHAGRPADAVPQLNRLLQASTDITLKAEATYWLGEAYYASGVLPAAVQTFEDLIERHPTSQRIEDALYAIGWAQFRQRKLERAEGAFTRLVKAYPLTVFATEAHLRRGDCLYLQRNYEAAADAYEQADSANAHPELSEYARYQAALARYHAKQPERALAGFSRFVEAHPASALADDANFMTGLIHFGERRYRDAVTKLGSVVATNPASPLAPRALATLSGAYYALGSFDSARTTAATVLDSFPTSGYVDDARGALDRAETALDEQQRIDERNRLRIGEAIATARALRDDGALDDALRELDRARARAGDDHTTALVLSEIARTHLQATDTVRAIGTLQQAARYSTTAAGSAALWSIAELHRDLGQIDSAVAYFHRAAAANDSTAQLAHVRIGQTYLGSERWTAALDAFNLAVAEPNGRARLAGEAHLGIATVHAARGERERAREIFQKLIREYAGDEISRRAQEKLRDLGNL